MEETVPKYLLLLIFMGLLTLPTRLQAVGMGNFVDEVYLQTETVGDVTFTHSKHGLNCKGCHPKIFIKKSNSNKVSMQAMEQGKFCGACHDGDKIFSVKENCLSCHDKAGDILYKDEDNGNVTFSHEAHVQMFSCDDCHPDLFKAESGANKTTMEEMEEGKSCGACHDGSDAFNVAEDCESCHDI
jgi:c(7)-type cytochrome triheme protein